MRKTWKEVGMKFTFCGIALALVSAIGYGSFAYAQEDTKSAREVRRAAAVSFFDPFLLTRVVLAPSSSVTVRTVYGGMTVRASANSVRANGNGNGNGNQPPGLPVVPGRPEFRSNWCPPFGWAWGPGGNPA